jgi:chromosome segregation ATPase
MINVNVNTIENYLSDVESVHREAREKAETTQNVTREVLERACKALEKAEEALALMESEEEMAKETLEHDKKVLQLLYEERALVEKAKYEAWDVVCATGNAYRKAAAAATSAKNSSSGSTPEEKKAHADAVKVANEALKAAKAQYAQAQETYNKLCQRLIELGGEIANAERVIRELEYLLSRLAADIQRARDYCYSVARQIDALKNAYNAFIAEANKVLEGLNKCYNSGVEARDCIAEAVKALSYAGGEAPSAYKKVCMGDTRCLETMYDSLDNTALQIERSCESLKNDTRSYAERMSDAISEAAVAKAQELHSGLSKKQTVFMEIRSQLITAKNQLDAYLSYSSVRL